MTETRTEHTGEVFRCVDPLSISHLESSASVIRIIVAIDHRGSRSIHKTSIQANA